MKEGDIYRWKWADPERDENGFFGDYHCKSQIAIFEGGVLRDTFWSSCSDGHLDRKEVVLTFLCNKHDMEEIPKCKIPYYDEEDIVDTRHSNNSNAPIYLRKGANRSAKSMLLFCEQKIHENEAIVNGAISTINHLREVKAEIEGGELDEIILY